VVLSTTGLLARTAGPPAPGGRRAAHDTLRAAVPATVRGQVALVTNRGRLLRLDVLDAPALPPTDEPPALSGAVPVGELAGLDRGERVVSLARLEESAPPLTLATAVGQVKRVAPERAPNRDAWEVIALRDGDEVVGAAEAGDDDELVLLTDDAQLLRFPAASVRPQGRAAAGMAGIRLAESARVVCLGVVRGGAADDAVVVTVAGSAAVLPGTVPGTAKVTPFALYPAKGRATGGVRAHRFLRGEDRLDLAWVGPAPARASGSGGQPVELPAPDPRRDGSGSPLDQPVVGIG
jgi:DNA gyrase subunit A